MNLVISASGYLGMAICQKLTASGLPVRGLVRKTSDTGRMNALKAMGVELVYGDVREPESLAAACKGVEMVIASATMATDAFRQPTDSIEATDQQGHLNAIAAAKAAGVKQYVYVSYSGNIDAGPNPCPLTVAKRTVEAAVRASGMTYTILRPTYFSEVWLSPVVGFDYPNAKASIYGEGQNKISWISLVDVAEFAVRSLGHPAALNAVIELGGPQALSPLEVVAVFEKVSGRHFEVSHVPVAALQAQQAGATDSLSKSFSGLMIGYAQGDVIDMRATLQKFPITLTSVQEYAQRVSAPVPA